MIDKKTCPYMYIEDGFACCDLVANENGICEPIYCPRENWEECKSEKQVEASDTIKA